MQRGRRARSGGLAGLGRVLGPALCLALVVVIAGCSYDGPAGNFFSQRLSFFSYMNGDDIRETCEAGGPDRYRFVYVANFRRQTRMYDALPTAEGWMLRQQVDRGLLVNSFQLDSLLSLGTPARAAVPLGEEEVAELEEAMFASGVFTPPPVGLRLDSEGFFWVVTGCHRGDYFLTGYRYPSNRWDDIRFDEFLFERDRLDAQIRRPPDRLPNLPVGGCRQRTQREGTCFTVEVGEDGLVGIWTIN